MDDLQFLTLFSGQPEIPESSPVPTSGLQLWLDASDARTITTATGVSQWVDKSGTGNTVIQATGTKQPAYVLGAQNGLNALRFTGIAQQHLAKASPTNLTGVSAATIFFVTKRSEATGVDTVAGAYVASDGNRSWRLYSPNAGQGRDFGSSADGANVVVNEVTQGTTGVAALTYVTLNGTNLVLTSSGTGDTELQSALFASPADFLVGAYGGGDYWAGDIMEILFYNRLLVAGEITQVNSYLTTKWAIA